MVEREGGSLGRACFPRRKLRSLRRLVSRDLQHPDDIRASEVSCWTRFEPGFVRTVMCVCVCVTRKSGTRIGNAGISANNSSK